MKRKFISNLILLLFLNILIKPLYAFGIDVSVQNTVGAVNYGTYFILLNFILIFQIILDVGIDNFSRREIARQEDLLNNYISKILPFKFILGIFYFLLCSGIGLLMGWGSSELNLLFILIFNQFLAGFILYLRANIGGMHLFKADSILSVTDKFIVIVICGLLLLNDTTHQRFRIEWLIYAQTFAYSISAFISFMIVYKRTRPLHFTVDFSYYRNLLRQTMPFAILILLMATYSRIDTVLLGQLLENGNEQAGIYAQSYRIIEIFSNYGYLFTLLLLPLFSRMIKHNEPVNDLTLLSFTLLFVPAVIVTLGCFLFKNEIIDLLYNTHQQISARVFSILIFSFLGMCITYIFGTLLTANGSLRQLNKMAVIAVIINILLNLILIKKYGVIGAAMANIATQIFTSAYQVILARHIFHFKTNFVFITRLIIFIALTFFSGLIIRITGINFVLALTSYLALAALLSVLTRLIKIKPVINMLSQNILKDL